jgi:hypothetical protein
MIDCTERSEGQESMPREGTAMIDCTERSEGQESMPREGTA